MPGGGIKIGFSLAAIRSFPSFGGANLGNAVV